MAFNLTARGLVLLLLLLVACRGRPPNPEALFQDARRAFDTGNLELAARLAEQGLDRRQAPSESLWHYRFLLLKAEILYTQGQNDAAEALLPPTIPDDPGFSEIKIRFLIMQARIQYGRKQYQAADRLLTEANQLAQETRSTVLLAQVALRRGYLHTVQKNFAAAEDCYQRAYQGALAAGDRFLQNEVIGNMGFNLLQSSRYDEAIPKFEVVLKAAEEAGDRKSVARSWGNLGTCYYQLGDFDKALEFLKRAESLTAELKLERDRQIWLGNIGDVYYERVDYKNAISYFHRALKTARELSDPTWTANWLNNLSIVQRDKGDLNAAERYNQESQTIQEGIKERDLEIYLLTLANGAQLRAARRQFAEAESIYLNVIERAENARIPRPLWLAHVDLGSLYAQTRQAAKAEAHFESALSTVETVRSTLLQDEFKITFQSRLIDLYRNYIDFLMNEGKTEKALDAADSSRARVLAEKLGLDRQSLFRTQLPRLRQLSRRLDAVFLSYWLGPKSSFLWVVTPKDIRSFILPDESRIRSLVEAYGNIIRNAPDGIIDSDPTAGKLYQVLLAPASELIPPGARVVLVPDGCLHELNFETLRVMSGEPRYWIEDVTIAVAPSLGVLQEEASASATSSKSMLLIGDAVPVSDEFPRLKSTAVEIERIKKQFDHPTVLTGPTANPAAYGESQPGLFRLIHFSAHATPNRQSPLNSAVILSPTSETYKLYARDVMNTHLQAQIVTISACHSAGARSYSGEGLVGFMWAFLQAGARNVIAGLWDVNDRSTAELMGGFYEHVNNGESPAQALRSAKLDLLNAPGAYRLPYYWAPFQLFTRSDPFAKPSRASRRVAELFPSRETATGSLSLYGWRDGASLPGLAR
jgi:CHAT domain-containing protein/Tfp pilus assembly protein PilF